THPRQLVGKTVMDSLSTPAVAPMLLSQAGSLKNFKLLAQRNNLDALIEGRLDAVSGYSTDQPFYFSQKQFPVSVLKPIHYGVDFYGDNLFTSEDELQNHRERAQNFLAASLCGWKYAMEHPDETIGFVQKYGSRNTPEHLRFEYEAMRDLILPEFIEIGQINPERWRHIADTYVRLGQLKPDYSLEGLLYEPDLLADIAKLKAYLNTAVAIALLAGLTVSVFWYFNQRLREQKKALSKSEEQLNLLITHSPAALAMFDRNLCYIAVSNRWRSDFRLGDQNLVGRSHYEIFPETPESWREVHQRCLKGSSVKCEETFFIRTDGTSQWIRGEARPWFRTEREIGGIIIFSEDISGHKDKEAELREANALLKKQLAEIKSLQNELREQTVRDPLTGLFNRRYLDETLARELSRAKRDNSPLSVAILDIDYFKRLNDTHGHDAGDLMLQSMALQLLSSTRNEDMVCRYGGEEFVVVLPDTTLEHARQRMEQLRASFEQLYVPFNQVHLHNTVSIGIANYPIHGTTDAQLLRAADMALYEAKGAGRNRVMCAQKSAGA
ncbi:MAG: diguanylate cyclase, partial [Methylococcaceae bacterium]|nr:diguanylate cyclase [Methylococcaceae bacterium]